MLTWEMLTRAWGKSINERDPGAILPVLADDFFGQHLPGGPRAGYGMEM